MTTCPRCQQPIDPTQPTATMTYCGKPMEYLHVQCGKLLQSWLRDFIISNNRVNDVLIRERDSMRIVPAQETDDDGLTFDSHGELVAWAH